MQLRFLTLACPVTVTVTATATATADAALDSPEPIAKQKELLFSDDFERAELGKDKGWAIVVPT